MLKKIIGIISVLLGLFAIWTAFKDGNGVLYLFGPLCIATGVFVLLFDNAHNKSYKEGFKIRKTQDLFLVVLTILWCILFAIAMIGLLSLVSSGAFSSFVHYIVSFLSILIMFVPGFTIMRLLDLYHKPFAISKKYFLTNDEAIEKYLGNNEVFDAYSKNDFVYASKTALFFKKSFCVIPFDQIRSVENKKTIDGPTVRINLANGKSFKMLTKQYDDIMSALNSNQ